MSDMVRVAVLSVTPTTYEVERKRFVKERRTIQLDGSDRWVERDVDVPETYVEKVTRTAVTYAPLDHPDLLRVTNFAEMMQPRKGAINPDSLLETRARNRWAVIEPYVDAARTGKPMAERGEPLAKWDKVDPATALLLKQQLHLSTVEDLAFTPDESLRRVMGSVRNVLDLKAAARTHLSASGERQLREENERLRKEHNDQLAAQNDQIAEMRTMLEQLVNAGLAKAQADAPKTQQGQQPPRKVA